MSGALTAMLALAAVAVSTPALADPPGRVVRLGYMSGDISFQQGGDDRWTEASLNRPLVPGDGLYVDRASRVEMEVGAATVRLDERSQFRVLNLDDSFAQMELTEGVLNLRVRRVFEGDSYEIDTPTLAFVVDRPGSYRVDIAPDGSSTMITVFEGGGTVYGENNARYSVDGGRSFRFYDSSLRDYETLNLPRPDDFDRWCQERDGRYERSVSRRYVSEEVIGYADLDDYGSWSTVETYGSVWFPTRVDIGWAPYRHGRWMWIDPWGWSWVDRSPWGFAPFHYGRWCQVGSRWGWVPGPRHVRPVYAPALVAFVGGHNFGVSINVGGPIGWFPLGPRDVYVPWYRGSRTYFNNINVHNTTIINNIHITNVYNNYSRGRPVNNFNYAFRNNERAFSAVSREDFVGARQVDRSLLRVDRAQLGRGEVLSRVDVTPVAASFRGGSETVNRVRQPSVDVARRSVIARTEPTRTPAIQNRLREIERNGNQPLAMNEMRDIARQAPAPAVRAERVRVVGNAAEGTPRTAQPLPPREAGERSRAPVTRTAVEPVRDARTGREDQRAPTPVAPSRSSQGMETRRQPVDANDRRLPSSGYAPARETRMREERGPQPSRDVQVIGRDGSTAPVRTQAPTSERRVAPRSNDDQGRGIAIPQRQPIERRESVQTRQAPVPVERREPARSERSAPIYRDNSPQPRSVQPQAPQRIERSVPVQQAPRVQPPQRVEPAAPPPVQRSNPQPVQRSMPQPTQRSAPQPQPREQEAQGRSGRQDGGNERRRRED
ncbi:DUF6600 domain-containing protein [Dokdonella sp.]|uniref:DUF6600 domain-containing protein n=1 Tax=Dokdonella sp. TaxID=2291710 RepID=UPI0025BE7CAC|nr:DUF6600 domain-containing protein [Dokdonella sp.]MBX3692322.1 hypothetical protein [Dokdonella sp.]